MEAAAVTRDAVIGVDVGGTHTDVAAIVGGQVARGKALTTYDDFSRGMLDAVTVAAEAHGFSLESLLARTSLFINGTTVVTNALTTLQGARVGVIVTRGFKDTFRIAGGPRVSEYDDHLQLNAPDIFDRRAIAEIDGRIDWAGAAIAPINPDQVRAEVRRLVEEEHVESVAVCLMSSFANPEHENEVGQIIKAEHPDLFVSLSHQVGTVIGENRRWTTTVLNCFVEQRARLFLDSVSTSLRTAGLQGGLVFFQGLGGGISLERAKSKPIALMGSGPAGGAIGANALARRMGRKHILLGDMGGTSFDTGIIVDNEIRTTKNVSFGVLHTGINLVDVVSVGAGGGSVAWIGERGVPQVGPESAGSDPGPVSYGQGGERPTVTDAMVALGIIDPDRYLGGRFQLHSDAAREALEQRFGSRFGWSVEESASAIHDLVVMNMATAVHEVSVAKGYDPRDFVFLAYGGTLPMFAVQIAQHLGMSEVVIPDNSSVFCALGLLSADFVMRLDQTVAWNLSRADGVDRVNEVAERMVTEGKQAMREEGFSDEEISVSRSGDFRFLGQSYELSLPLPDRPLTPDDAPQLAKSFFDLYEQTYGEGTAWKGVPEQMLNYTITVSGRREQPEVESVTNDPRSPEDILLTTRRVFLPSTREFAEVGVYDDSGFTAGTEVTGPSIIDASDTTIFVPPGSSIRRDTYANYILTTDGESR